MDTITAIKQRHSVRSYFDKPLENDVITALKEEISLCNKESGLNIQLVTNEPKAFESFLAKYGKFSNVTNYIALVGNKTKDFDEKIGYYGERIVIKAQMLGLNTCWVGGSFGKGSAKKSVSIEKGEKLGCVISIGYGTEQGKPHKSKPIEVLCKIDSNMPEWFKNGMELAMLAPTAINQQKFLFVLTNGKVSAKVTGGVMSKIDLGIAKYHFEIGSDRKFE